MAEFYNPVVRTFNRLRAGLVSSLGVDRRHVWPEMPLELLIPLERRREVWGDLRQAGLEVPRLELSPQGSTANGLLAVKTVVSLAVGLQAWWLLLPGLPVAWLPLRLLADWATRGRAVYFPFGLTTVGDLALYLTSFREHKDSGYRPTRNEIEFKVRQVVAETLDLEIDAVPPEAPLAKLVGC
jgi:hypothetical protein